MTIQPIFLEGKSTILRALNKATDLEDILFWINASNVRRYIKLAFPVSRAEEERWFDNLDYTKDQIFAVEIKESRKLIGTMGLHRINWINRRATTGAIIGPEDCRGKGYGRDAKMVLLDYAFNTLNLKKICSGAIEYNKASLRFNEKCGYREEGRLKRHFFREGEWHDSVITAVFKEDWLPLWEEYKKEE